jgi:tetratricopeptide (TPR) repeat protein
MKSVFLSHFTPSLMNAKTLESIFVQRQALVVRLLEEVKTGVTTASKHHTILVGPRGIGKTHLVTLLYYRLKNDPELTGNMRIAWLREDEWGITSFLDVLLRIYRALSSEWPEEFPAKSIEQLFKLSNADAETALAKILKERLNNKVLVLLTENLDEIFRGIQELGQKRWRAYLQEHQFFTIVATSQSLFNGVSRHSSPFYGFFRIQHLDELGLEDAIALLIKIASLNGDQELIGFLSNPLGRARVRALQHLAGGNPRIYVIFSQFLSKESLTDLVEPFMSTIDELTPYYQARMSWLSAQQRKIIEYLCDIRRALPVREIASRCFMSQQTASSQLKELANRGYVRSTSFGRESYYELREPLMRICIDVKKNRGEPIRLLVDFIRFWYTRSELHDQLRCLSDGDAYLDYLKSALSVTDDGGDDPRIHACKLDSDKYHAIGDFKHGLEAAEELIAVRGSADDWSEKAHCLCHLARWDDAISACNSALKIDPSHLDALSYIAWAYEGVGKVDLALNAIDNFLKLDQTHSVVWLNRANLLIRVGRLQEALQSASKATSINRNFAPGWVAQGIAHGTLGEHGKAARAFVRACTIAPEDASAWFNLATAYRSLGQYDKAIKAFERGFTFEPAEPRALLSYGMLQLTLRNYEGAIVAIEQSISINPSGLCAHFHRVEAYVCLNQKEKGDAALVDALVKFKTNDEGALSDHITMILDRMLTNVLMRERGDWVVSTFKIFRKVKRTRVLSICVARSIRQLLSGAVSEQDARQWRDLWQQATNDRREFELTLSLLNVAIEYKNCREERVKMVLADEERRIFDMITEDLEPEIHG